MDSRVLPDQFAAAYEALYVRALSDGSVSGGDGGHPLSGSAGVLGRADGKPVGQYRVSSGENTSIGKLGGPKTKQVGKTSRFLKDERAFRQKQRVDKQLRKISREIMAFLDGENGRGVKLAGYRVCTGKCKKFGDGEWSFCARCGGPMREVEQGD